MSSKEIVENIFTKNGINWEIKDFNSYIDPKCKTSKSIYSKLIRLYSNNNYQKEFTVSNSGINDLLRMTVIVEYSEVIPTIQKLKQKFPDLTGYLKLKDSGYCGIHLNLKIDGLPCEIQLAPKIVVMATNYLHTFHEKWRDFDSSRELELIKQKEQELLKNNNIQEKKDLFKTIEKEKSILQDKIQDEKKDFELRSKTYNEIYNVAKFPFYQEDITKTINELNKNKEESIPLTNKKLKNILNINLLTKENLDKYKIMQVAEQLPQNIETTQDKFVNLVKDCLQL